MKRDWKVYEPKFGTWASKIKPFWESGGLDTITDFIQGRVKKGHVVLPESKDVFRCFTATPIDRVKAVICGFCPYHTMINGVPVADGLCMSCSKTRILQPSLEQFYQALENEFDDGLCLKCDRNPDLSYLAEQGVMLFNSSLTTELHKVARHQDIWSDFTSFIIDQVIGYMTDVPVVFLGKEASKFEPYLAPFQWSFCISHPASASYSGTVWDSEGTFKKINKILKDLKKEEIVWVKEVTN